MHRVLSRIACFCREFFLNDFYRETDWRFRAYGKGCIRGLARCYPNVQHSRECRLRRLPFGLYKSTPGNVNNFPYGLLQSAPGMSITFNMDYINLPPGMPLTFNTDYIGVYVPCGSHKSVPGMSITFNKGLLC